MSIHFVLDVRMNNQHFRPPSNHSDMKINNQQTPEDVLNSFISGKQTTPQQQTYCKDQPQLQTIQTSSQDQLHSIQTPPQQQYPMQLQQAQVQMQHNTYNMSQKLPELNSNFFYTPTQNMSTTNSQEIVMSQPQSTIQTYVPLQQPEQQLSMPMSFNDNTTFENSNTNNYDVVISSSLAMVNN